MKELILILTACFILTSPAAADEWRQANQTTVAWDHDRNVGDTPGAGVAFNNYIIHESLAADEANKMLVGTTTDLSFTHTFTGEGKFRHGISAVKVVDGEQVAESQIAWSNNPADCLDGATFGTMYYIPPAVPANLHK